MEKTSRSFINDFTAGSIPKTLMTFAIPIFLSNLLQVVYNMVDMVVVGQVVGEAGLSGISVGSDVLHILTFVTMGFSSASQVIISQYIGAGWRERLSRFIGTMFTFLLCCGVVMGTLCLLLRNQILGWLNTPAEAWDQAMSYIVTCVCGMLFIVGYNAVSSILRGMGDSKRPCVFIAIAAALNLILDLIFVAGFGWEAFGAALATVIAQGVSFIISVIYLYRNKERFVFDFALRSFRIHKIELLTLVRLGVPMALRVGSVQFSKLFVSSWVNDFGVTVSAVFGIGNKLDTIANLIVEALATAGSSMVGQNIGAGKYKRVSRILGTVLMISCSVFVVIITVTLLFPRFVFGIFTSEAGVLAVCMEYLPVLIVTFTACALRSSMNSFTHGVGNYKFNFAVAIIDGIIARIGLSLLLGAALGLGYFGFWMGNAIAASTPFFLGGIYYLSGRWKKKSSLLIEDPETEKV